MGKLENLVPSHVGYPNIIFIINAETMWHDEQIPAPFGHQFTASAVKYSNGRGLYPVLGKRVRPLTASPMEDKDVVVRVHCYSGCLTEYPTGG